MIEARGISRQFGSLLAVEDVSLRVAEGTLLALLGPNGAGKTTTVRMLSGLLAPSSGWARVAGCDVRTDPTGVRARIGLVTDVAGLYEQMSVVNYLQFFGRLYGLEPGLRSRRIDELLRLFELYDRRASPMVTFSRGMQQKVALARALLHEPAVLFLDEPTAGLDPLAARSVRELILSLKHARRSIVLCTHDLDEAERLADQVAIMAGGRIMALDAPSELRQRASPETHVRIALAEPFPAAAPTGLVEFRTSEPTVDNPRRVAELVSDGARVVSVTLSTRTLEDVYAAAVNGHGQAFAALPGIDGALDTGPVAVTAVDFPNGDSNAGSPVPVAPLPGDVSTLLVIAWRAALESLNDRMTRLMNVFFALIAPVALLVLVVRPLSTAGVELPFSVLPFYLLVVGMMPAVGAVGIAAGQFAGEKERGVLTPLLASPASNLAIFGGKVLGSIVPPVLYSVIAEAIYIGGIAVLLGTDRLAQLPPALTAALILLVPAATCLAAIIGTLVSSRVRSFNAAQQIAGIVLIPLWGGLFALAAKVQDWGNLGLFGTVGGLLVLDAVLTSIAARTWQREEILSKQ